MSARQSAEQLLRVQILAESRMPWLPYEAPKGHLFG